MQYTTEQIKKYLKDYHIYKGKVESGSATTDICQSLESLEKCVSVLDEESYTIITSLFFEKVSASRLVNRLNRSRSGLYLRVNIIAQMLAKAMSKIV